MYIRMHHFLAHACRYFYSYQLNSAGQMQNSKKCAAVWVLLCNSFLKFYTCIHFSGTWTHDLHADFIPASQTTIYRKKNWMRCTAFGECAVQFMYSWMFTTLRSKGMYWGKGLAYYTDCVFLPTKLRKRIVQRILCSRIYSCHPNNMKQQQ